MCALSYICLLDPCHDLDPLKITSGSTDPNANTSRLVIDQWLEDKGLPPLGPSDCGGYNTCLCNELETYFEAEYQVCAPCLNTFTSDETSDSYNVNNDNIELVYSKYYLSEFDVIVSPNPFQDKINLELYIGEQSDVKIQVVNVLGEVQWAEEHSVNKGQSDFEINLDSGLSLGIYYIYVSDSNGNQTVKKVVHTSN